MRTRAYFLPLMMAFAALGANAGSRPTPVPDHASEAHSRFDWRGANVYFVITDRFCNGDPTNDQQYGRCNDYGSEQLNAATFHGGDLAGLLKKAQEGWFKDMGIDVLWMTDVYEQIHGWMSGSGEINDFPHYGYHGYYPLDYTQTDRNYGTIDELRALVDCLHAQGIRVMLGANLNNPGYPTLLDAYQYGFAPVEVTSAAEAVVHDKNWSYNQWAEKAYLWTDWWGRDWLRMTDEDWNPDDPLTCTLYGLPDFKTEKTEAVGLPAFLKKKWQSEETSSPYTLPNALREDRPGYAPMDYLIAWIAAWVEEFGIDGFRCDIVEYVHLHRWQQLSEACNQALDRWRSKHPEDPAAKWTDPVYLTGDMDYADIRYLPEYAQAGFGSMVNFYFPKHGDMDNIVYTWQAYADSLHAHTDWGPFSYQNNSYHRDLDTLHRIDCATALLLSPGTIQLFYGDETARGLSDAQYNVDRDQAFRSDMNWDNIDTTLLAHYQSLGKIRQAHPAIGLGKQITLDPHTCVRIHGNDTVLISVAVDPGRTIPTGGWFDDKAHTRELYNRHGVVILSK